MDDSIRAKMPRRIPSVLSAEEVQLLLGCLSEKHPLIVSILYGNALRLMECLRQRVKDLDFDRYRIMVGQGKGRKDSD